MVYICVCVCLVSLEDVLASGVPWKLPVVWQCASRLIKAAKALHENGILYLCWKRTSYLSLQIPFISYCASGNILSVKQNSSTE